MTPPALRNAEKLRRIAAALAIGEMPAAEDAQWMAERFRFYLDELPRGGTFEAAYDLTNYGSEILSERDRLIVEIATRFFPDRTPPRAGAAIAAEVIQYERAEWRADRERGRSARHPVELRARLYELRLLGPVPAARRLGDILRANWNRTAA